MTMALAGFEELFASTYVGYANADVVGSLEPPPPELIYRVHLVATPESGTVTVCSFVEGWRFLPGGRLEPRESLETAATRELFEESGCEPLGPVRVFFSQVP